MLLPALSKAKTKAQGIQCMSNHRQLCLAWRLYADDSRDNLVYASDCPNCFPGSQQADQYAWTWTKLSPNTTSTASPADYDPSVDIMKRPLWPYVKNPGVYRCPADRSLAKTAAGDMVPRVRTMSMNLFVGGFDGTDGGWKWADRFCIYTKLSQIGGGLPSPGPAKTWVFLDMREDLINWGNYMTYMLGFPTTASDSPSTVEYAFSQDMPGIYHNLACGFSFADGHSEIHKWRDSRTCPALYSKISDPWLTPRSQDVAWLQDHATRPKNWTGGN
jgi:hypothetical protein